METLSNITINMNLTMIESMSAEPIESEAALMKEYNSFYRAGTAAAKKNQTTDRYFEMENVYSNMKQFAFLNHKNSNNNARQMPRIPSALPSTTTPKPAIVNIATQPQHRRVVEPEVKIIEMAHEQYIKPLALQNMQPNEPKKSAIFQDSSTNIEDLKRHIVLLHNLTKQDKGFESKFVVFPNLKKDDPTPSPTTTQTTTVITTVKASTTPTSTSTTTKAVPVPVTTELAQTTMRPPTTQTEETSTPTDTTTPSPSTTSTTTLPNDVNLMDDMDMPPSERSTALLFLKPTMLTRNKSVPVDDDFFNRLEQVTSFPQVFLQNDQTPMMPTEPETTTKKTKPGGGGGLKKQQRRQNNKQKGNGNNNNKNRKNKKKDKNANRMCKEVGNKFIGNCSFASNWNEKEQEDQRNSAGRDPITTSLPVNGEYIERRLTRSLYKNEI